MSTIAIQTNHFSGGAALTTKPSDGRATLEELIGQAKTDIVVLETYMAGLQDPKDSVLLATAAALPACTAAGSGAGKTLTANANGQLTVDGTALTASHVGKRVLVKDQVAGKDNGIYDITAPGTASTKFVLTRSADADSSSEVTPGLTVSVEEGTANADKIFQLTTNATITLDTTALVFAEIAGIAHAASHISGAADEVDGDVVDIDYTPSNYTRDTTPAEVTTTAHLTAHLAGIDNELVDVAQMEGAGAAVLLVQSGQPTATQTLVIGADTYEFDGVGANINVVIAGGAEGTLDNLITAINTNGTENLVATKSGTTIAIIRTAVAPGGAVAAADPSIAVDASGVTNYAFNEGDINMNTLGGVAAVKSAYADIVLAITTAMITATTHRIPLPFTPRGLVVSATSSGVPVAFTADAVAISGTDIVLTLGTDLANGDIVAIHAFE